MQLTVERHVPVSLRAVALVAIVAIGASASAADAPSGAVSVQSHALSIEQTNLPPTGYSVTFRYYDPEATRVQIRGDWSFTTTAGTTGVSPSDWEPGAFPSGEAVTDMTEIANSGLWTYSTPLPSGVFNYGFVIDCSNDGEKGCPTVSDPNNSPWNAKGAVVRGSVAPMSQVFVPSDRTFGTVDYWWQGPESTLPRGALANVAYPSPTHVSPAGENHLAVYTPPGYDPGRAEPYPTLYLSHGGGGNEMDWSTQGAVPNIMDSLVNTGHIQPMVVVMINFEGFDLSCPAKGWVDGVGEDIVNNVVPYVEAHYDVTKEPAGRAFAGLSCGGALGEAFLINQPAEFGYYGIFSPGGGNPFTDLTDKQAAALRGLAIFIGGGYQEPTVTQGKPGPRANAVNDVALLTASGITVTPEFINGTHEWYVWRILLHDYLLHVAFAPLPDRLGG